MNTNIENNMTFIQEDITNKVDDLLLDNEVALEEKKKIFNGYNNRFFDMVEKVEESTLELIIDHLGVFFNEMRYQKMKEVLSDSSLTENQKEVKLQDNLLNVYQLQNKVEEMLLDNSIKLENINQETKDYFKNSFTYGEEFVSEISIRLSSLFR
ncbi:hypothetical protein [Flammeovirga kamogawensis]|uniref:DUF2383 domain-containing protein n=1 Tax=Flammeovirga kamogawensis TaxID=373891 RepID=A0ABX8GT77_9BACT|nr:hypothetical protein [Flammeovirga kamogawensis]MBB6461475.1 alcohol dehydrogenase YqhD (iron-dependent ADH family) [Flammeovirga kamogawensis]QWG06367.1 hypothetical protein KM029_13635 [Flammeovirga kamogawensis]TRX68196.1 hypothetical protein EO216_08650 [Flammeovirga kamogawensis]